MIGLEHWLVQPVPNFVDTGDKPDYNFESNDGEN
jgi:hypothetical protein